MMKKNGEREEQKGVQGFREPYRGDKTQWNGRRETVKHMTEIYTIRHSLDESNLMWNALWNLEIR